MTRRKPTDAEFKQFWSVFEAKQQRKRDQLNQLPHHADYREDNE